MGVRRSLLVALSLSALASACASRQDPATAAAVPATPPQTVSPVAPAEPEPHVEEPVAVTPRPNETVVIEEGGEKGTGRDLAEAARQERERRRDAPPPVVVVTDKNLETHATGNLTFSDRPAVADGEGTAATENAAEAQDRERYWRDRLRDHRQEWADAVEEIFELEQEVSELRVRFYAEDDPYVRDGRIKPQWDSALERLADARRRAERLEQELDGILEEGRRAGALPGWLREGSELEPEKRPYGERLEEEEDQGIVGEPVIVDEN